MPTYKYKVASSSGGEARTVSIEAETKEEALEKLRMKGLVPIKFAGVANTSGFASLMGRGTFDQVDFTKRLLPLLKAQIPIEKALGIITDGSDDEPTKLVVSDLRKGLHEGKKFSALIREKNNVFSSIYANMVEAGEESGSLVEVMEELRKFLQARKELKTFLATSMIYPAIVLTVTSGVVVLLFTVFIPKFSKTFSDLGKELPLPTKIMLKIGAVATHPVTIALVILAISGIVVFILKARQGGPTREWWDKNIVKSPIIGTLIVKVEVAKFVRTMAVLLQNHVRILDTVAISKKVVSNSIIAKSLDGVASDLRSGVKLSKALSKSAFIPATVLKMVAIGEETGNVGEMMGETASLYESEIKDSIKRLLALFEPAVILFLAMVVLAVVLSIFLAMMELNDI